MKLKYESLFPVFVSYSTFTSLVLSPVSKTANAALPRWSNDLESSPIAVLSEIQCSVGLTVEGEKTQQGPRNHTQPSAAWR